METSQKIQNALKCSLVMMSENITQLSAERFIDFMWLERAPVLNVVDASIHLSAAQFVIPQTTKSENESVLMIWESVYTSLQAVLVLDNGSNSEILFLEICEIHFAEW